MTTEQFIREEQDRRAIREVVDQYAYCADTRNATGQMALFTEDTQFIVYMDSKSDTPTQVITKRADLFPVFDNLNTYHATMHFNGQSTVTLEGDRAHGITYCRAHHLTVDSNGQHLMIATIRYHDIFIKQAEKWLFAERKLLVDWIENK
ncbi:nuclear transport factor 2 family protein [Chitinophaga arvensicola]|uniref:SnoaL-like domain-containing protein n=1 Tax=Chitinophaga arvensicola TaxID=29529 RepID=A0A1I0S4B8_9BACT|nr:nuclear transport factor 2 family protein [Chitinophaga arvensicola]SEW49621.1 SnoaL-like domain-containing protein [Chitinophaga arvensicola]